MGNSSLDVISKR